MLYRVHHTRTPTNYLPTTSHWQTQCCIEYTTHEHQQIIYLPQVTAKLNVVSSAPHTNTKKLSTYHKSLTNSKLYRVHHTRTPKNYLPTTSHWQTQCCIEYTTHEHQKIIYLPQVTDKLKVVSSTPHTNTKKLSTYHKSLTNSKLYRVHHTRTPKNYLPTTSHWQTQCCIEYTTHEHQNIIYLPQVTDKLNVVSSTPHTNTKKLSTYHKSLTNSKLYRVHHTRTPKNYLPTTSHWQTQCCIEYTTHEHQRIIYLPQVTDKLKVVSSTPHTNTNKLSTYHKSLTNSMLYRVHHTRTPKNYLPTTSHWQNQCCIEYTTHEHQKGIYLPQVTDKLKVVSSTPHTNTKKVSTYHKSLTNSMLYRVHHTRTPKNYLPITSHWQTQSCIEYTTHEHQKIIYLPQVTDKLNVVSSTPHTNTNKLSTYHKSLTNSKLYRVHHTRTPKNYLPTTSHWQTQCCIEYTTHEHQTIIYLPQVTDKLKVVSSTPHTNTKKISTYHKSLTNSMLYRVHHTRTPKNYLPITSHWQTQSCIEYTTHEHQKIIYLPQVTDKLNVVSSTPHTNTNKLSTYHKSLTNSKLYRVHHTRTPKNYLPTTSHWQTQCCIEYTTHEHQTIIYLPQVTDKLKVVSSTPHTNTKTLSTYHKSLTNSKLYRVHHTRTPKHYLPTTSHWQTQSCIEYTTHEHQNIIYLPQVTDKLKVVSSTPHTNTKELSTYHKSLTNSMLYRVHHTRTPKNYQSGDKYWLNMHTPPNLKNVWYLRKFFGQILFRPLYWKKTYPGN